MYIDVTTAPYSANKTGTADARASFASADAAGGTLYVPRGTYRIDSDLTLSSDVHFEEGAVLRPNANVTVTLNGGLDAGVFQVFDVKTFSASQVTLKKVERLIPQWWGATGDGATDDYLPIAAALAVARKSGEYGSGAQGAIVFFPPGVYRVTKPLDCTAGQFNLRGSGQYQSVIRGDTGAGRAIIEMVGGGFSTVQALLLDTLGMSSPSTVGVFLARTKAPATGVAVQSSHIHLVDLAIRLQPDSGANGGHGTVAVYNYCSEVANYHGVFALADTAAVYTSNNLYDLDSYHRPRSTAGGLFNSDSSMTACTVTGHSSLWGLAGPGLRLNGCANIHVHADIATGGTAYPYAIEVLAQVTDFEYSGSMEGYLVLLRNRSFIYGMRLLGYAAYSGKTTYINPTAAHPTNAAIILLDPPNSSTPSIIQGSTINVVPNPGTSAGYLVDQAVDPATGNTTAAAMIMGCHVMLGGADIRIRNPWGNSVVSGNLMITRRNLADVEITAPAVTGNVIVAADRVNAGGVLLDGGKIGVGNSAAGSTLGTVVRKVEIFDAAGTSLGFVPVYNSIT